MKQTLCSLRLALEARGISVNEASKMSGIRYDTIWKHCEGMRSISAEMALRYEQTLKIPKSELRPDLWPEERGRDEANLLALCLVILTYGTDPQKRSLKSIAESQIVRPETEKES